MPKLRFPWYLASVIAYFIFLFFVLTNAYFFSYRGFDSPPRITLPYPIPSLISILILIVPFLVPFLISREKKIYSIILTWGFIFLTGVIIAISTNLSIST